MDAEKPIRKKRERSSNYPRLSLDACVKFVRAIKENAGLGDVSLEVLADMEQVATNNSRFRGLLSSSSQFALLEREGGLFSLTTLARQILFPKSDGDRREALLRAFQSPPLYAKIVNRYAGQKLPSENSLAKVAHWDFDIAENACLDAIKIFIESATYAGALSEDGILVLKSPAVERDESPSVIDVPFPGAVLENPASKSPFPAINTQASLAIEPGLTRMNISIPNENSQIVQLAVTSGTAYISVPFVFTRSDADKLKRQVDLLVNEREEV